MTNHPRYSPPPPHQGRRPGDEPHGGVSRSARAQRLPAAALRLAIRDTAAADHQQAIGSPMTRTAGRPSSRTPPLPPQARPAPKRSRAGALTAGALAVAVVSAGIGGGVALMAQARQSERRHVDHRGAERSGCQPPGRVRRTGRRQGGAQRREAGDRYGAGIRGGLRDHPVLRRSDPDQQPRGRGRQRADRKPRSPSPTAAPPSSPSSAPIRAVISRS